MRRTSCILCTILALLAVLSAIPLFLFFWVCDFSGACLSHDFARVMSLRGTVRILAIATLLAPFVALPAYTLAVLHHHRTSRDVFDHINPLWE